MVLIFYFIVGWVNKIYSFDFVLFLIFQMEQKVELAKLSKYKQFLVDNNFPENLPDYDVESYWDARY